MADHYINHAGDRYEWCAVRATHGGYLAQWRGPRMPEWKPVSKLEFGTRHGALKAAECRARYIGDKR